MIDLLFDVKNLGTLPASADGIVGCGAVITQ